MDSSALWTAVFFALAAGFGIGEIAMAGTFFLLPFAIGSLVAGIVSLLGASLLISFPLFLVVSLGVFLGLRPMARRLEASLPEVAGIGANRLKGQAGRVTEPIPAGVGRAGMVEVGPETWKAETASGLPVDTGATVRVIEIRGTRLVVEPVDTIEFT